MQPTALVALAGVGLAVGFLSGLVGIGGGVLIVPFLYFFYGHPAFSGAPVSPDLEAPVAHATSLFIIVPTAVVGTLTYAKVKLVSWEAVLPVAGFSVAAAALGANVAVLLPAEALKLVFGLFVIFAGVQLMGHKTGMEAKPMRLTLPVTATAGIMIGLLSALLGVGGGLVAIPLLIYLVRLDMPRVAATSLAVVMFAAAAGTVTYAIKGLGDAGLPDGSLGYVHLTAAVPILV
ncbi:MAG: sulfite exporter TauE/SafE family protein, partial [Longimicrobiales bacterium]